MALPITPNDAVKSTEDATLVPIETYVQLQLTVEKAVEYGFDPTAEPIVKVRDVVTREDAVILTNKNFNVKSCPYRVGDIYTTTVYNNPAVVWPGTTWERLPESRFPLNSNTSGQSLKIGGSNYISVANLPAHAHVSYPHTHTSAKHRHGSGWGENAIMGTPRYGFFTRTPGFGQAAGVDWDNADNATSYATTGTSSAATVSTYHTGSGTPYYPKYVALHMMVRKS